MAGQGYVCQACAQVHEGPPFAYGAAAPVYWNEQAAAHPASMRTPDQCVIAGEHFFLRAGLRLPVVDAVDAGQWFEWGVWVSLSSANYLRTEDLWETPGREQEPPMFGWLSTDLPTYEPTTVSLRTHVHTQPVGQRPLVELERTDHPLAVEQRDGITLARVRQIAERLLHHPG